MSMVKVKNADDLARGLQYLAGPGKYRLAAALTSHATQWIMRRMAGYPPETARNRPRWDPPRWYQRKFGPRWYRKKDGSIGGRNTSERLQDSWRSVTTGNVGRVWTDVSYAPYVVGSTHQADHHRRVGGWHTELDVMKEYVNEELGQAAKREITKVLRRVVKGGR